ncbi:hypothetical protein [Coprobacter secundus]|uniref:hypothetical protein n=1 Tax=Coprobacter secundus TaxID=1501392 RepID=UPI00190CCF7D|nr:hypothetical protein [Coprobacter secundus]
MLLYILSWYQNNTFSQPLLFFRIRTATTQFEIRTLFVSAYSWRRIAEIRIDMLSGNAPKS